MSKILLIMIGIVFIIYFYVSLIEPEPVTYRHTPTTSLQKLLDHRDEKQFEEETQAELLRLAIGSCEQRIKERQLSYTHAQSETDQAERYIDLYTEGI